MTSLAERFAAAANPTDDSDWREVVARSRRDGSPLRRKSLALALALVALLALGGTAVALEVGLLAQQERFHANEPADPERQGPLVEVVSGDDWSLIAWRSKLGICLDVAIPGNSPFGCGLPVRGAKDPTDASGSGLPTHAVAGLVSGGGLVGGDGKSTIFGVAAAEVATVEIELAGGRVIEAPVYDAPRELNARVRFFIVRLALRPTGLRDDAPVRAFLAYDDDGRLIERVED